jgi:hypothetical protein
MQCFPTVSVIGVGLGLRTLSFNEIAGAGLLAAGVAVHPGLGWK